MILDIEKYHTLENIIQEFCLQKNIIFIAPDDVEINFCL